MAERPEDLNLPNAVVTRIIKEALPDGVNVSKDARLAISKAASIFVLYATSCANNFAMSHKRKTISGQDVLDSMTDMEFEHFVDPLEACLQAYKEQQQGKKEASEKKKKAREEEKDESGNKEDEDKEDEVVEINEEEEEEEKDGDGDEDQEEEEEAEES